MQLDRHEQAASPVDDVPEETKEALRPAAVESPAHRSRTSQNSDADTASSP